MFGNHQNQKQFGPVGTFIALMISVAIIDWIGDGWLTDEFALESASLKGAFFPNVLTFHFLHADGMHLLSNCVVLLIFGLIGRHYGMEMVGATILSMLGSGLLAYFLSNGRTVGASGIAFGWFAFLVVRGWARGGNKAMGILISIVVVWAFGRMVLGVFPATTPAGVSWQGHLGGLLAGGFAAILMGKSAHPVSSQAQMESMGGMVLVIVGMIALNAWREPKPSAPPIARYPVTPPTARPPQPPSVRFDPPPINRSPKPVSPPSPIPRPRVIPTPPLETEPQELRRSPPLWSPPSLPSPAPMIEPRISMTSSSPAKPQKHSSRPESSTKRGPIRGIGRQLFGSAKERAAKKAEKKRKVF